MAVASSRFDQRSTRAVVGLKNHFPPCATVAQPLQLGKPFRLARIKKKKTGEILKRFETSQEFGAKPAADFFPALRCKLVPLEFVVIVLVSK